MATHPTVYYPSNDIDEVCHTRKLFGLSCRDCTFNDSCYREENNLKKKEGKDYVKKNRRSKKGN